MKRQMICIEWIDASISLEHDTYSYSQACNEGLIHGFVCGVLINETKTHYTVARDWFDLHDSYRGVASYPKSGILKVKKFDIFAKSKERKSVLLKKESL